MRLLLLELPDMPPWGPVAVSLDQPRGVAAVDEASAVLVLQTADAGMVLVVAGGVGRSWRSGEG